MGFDVYLNVVVGGVLTGLVYGLLALGLSVIFGVVRVVNFAHGEMMTIAMFIAVVLFSAFHLDPLILLVPIAAVMFVFGYVLQIGLINPFIRRAEHTQFLLLVALGLIIANSLLIVFGPDARSVQTSYALDSVQIGPLIVDTSKVYAGLAAIAFTAALFVFFRFTLIGKAIRACADNFTGAQVVGLDVKRLYALTFGLGAACVGAAGTMLTLLVDATPMLGPSYTLLAFVIVITGGLGSMPGALLGGVLVGVTEALAGLLVHPIRQEHVCFRHPRSGAAVSAARAARQEAGMIARLSAGLSSRGAILLAALFVVFLAAPLFVNDYLLTVLILIFYFAYAGQAWNIMMGFAGQLSLGHAIYIGFGAYVTATLFIRLGVSPWLGLFAAIPVAAACGAIIGFLAFRFRVAGVYFAILTIAFAEFARIGFDHLDFVNASGGLFLPVKQYAHNDPWQMRGDPRMFYYIILFATALIFVLCHLLVRSRVGYFWLAIREDEQAARATGIDTFRYKMYAVMVSAAATSFAGVFYAFYYNNLFPEQVFSISRSIEIILGPIIGGVGTLFGPILGAFVLTGLAEALNSAMTSVGIELPGATQVFYGVCLLLVVAALPDGVWPPLARRLGVSASKK